MEINLIEPIGYTETLTNLLRIATKARTLKPFSEIVLLGGLLNADSIKKELKKLNISIVDIPYEGFYDYVKSLHEDKVVLTSPYGSEKRLLALLRKKKIQYFDTTSPFIIKKQQYILKKPSWKKVIFVGNVNTIEESYLAYATRHKYIFVDIKDFLNKEDYEFKNKLNKKSTSVIYQTELADENLKTVLNKIKFFLPNVTIQHEISDENYSKKKVIDENLKAGDVLLIVSSVKKTDSYLLDYYHLNTKDVMYACITSVIEAMQLNINKNKKIYLVSDGSVSAEKVKEIYRYFYYKDIDPKSQDKENKVKIQEI